MATVRTHIKWQIYPPPCPTNGNFQLLLIDSYCENLYHADQVADLPPNRGIWWPRAVLQDVSLPCGKPFDQAE